MPTDEWKKIRTENPTTRNLPRLIWQLTSEGVSLSTGWLSHPAQIDEASTSFCRPSIRAYRAYRGVEDGYRGCAQEAGV